MACLINVDSFSTRHTLSDRHVAQNDRQIPARQNSAHTQGYKFFHWLLTMKIHTSDSQVKLSAF
jgi:hypothetical protein